MWIFVKQTQRVELVVNSDHIARLLGEGGIEVSDPRVKPVEEVHEPEQHEQLEEQHEEVHEVIDISKKRRRRASQ